MFKFAKRLNPEIMEEIIIIQKRTPLPPKLNSIATYSACFNSVLWHRTCKISWTKNLRNYSK